MVVFNNAIGRLSKATNLLPNTQKLRNRGAVVATSPHLGILAFETARTMSRLISLYRSLSDIEMTKLKDVMDSEGVAFLNSKDNSFLLRLACSERLEDLENAASTVARLGLKCLDFGLNRFDIVYNDLKAGIIDLGKLEYGSKQTEKRVAKMERLVMNTANLYSALEGLAGMEISERRMNFWKQKNNNGGGGGGGGVVHQNRANFDLFDQKISLQRKEVRRFRSSSLWHQTYDRSVGLMARTICIIYARICFVFGPYFSSLPRVTLKNVRSPEQRENLRNQQEYCLLEPNQHQVNVTRSGPIPMSAKPKLVRFHSQKSILSSPENRVFHVADPSTVGGSGLAVRYANVIVMAERYLEPDCTIEEDERESLYEMLPENLKLVVRKKLSKIMKTSGAAAVNGGDENMAKGWRDAVNEILKWLEPIATDTLIWQSERGFEKTKFEFNPSVLLLQTLHFSDKEKTEAAIAEVLVGLSCVCWYEDRRRCDAEDRDDSIDEISDFKRL